MTTRDQRRQSRYLLGSILACVVLTTLLLALPSHAQIPDKFTNLKVLPKNISRDSLEETMHGFTEALGVRCGYCHVRPQGNERGEPDWASDQKAEKQTARVMMRMTSQIRENDLSKITTKHGDRVVFSCRTCHHGQPRPWQIEDLLSRAYHSGGMDSLKTEYEALRNEYYGTDTYDFGERMLPDLGETLAGRDSAGIAFQLAEYNLSLFPQSGYTYLAIGRAYEAMGQKDEAIKNLQRAAELDGRLKDFVQRHIQRLESQ